jgi:hypothetical protein
MQSILIALAIVAAVVLIHFSYVDFRFRYRGGILWLWLLRPAPPLMWAGRATIAAAVLVGLAASFVGAGVLFGLLLGGLIVLHIVCLILLELLEPRGP